MQLYASGISVNDIHTLIKTGVNLTLIDEHEEYGEEIRVKLFFKDGVLVETYSEADYHYIDRSIDHYNLQQFRDFEIIDLPVVLEKGMTAEELFSCLMFSPNNQNDNSISIYTADSFPKSPQSRCTSLSILTQPTYQMGSTKFSVGGIGLRQGEVTVSISVSRSSPLAENDFAILRKSRVMFCFLRFNEAWYGVGNGWIVPN